MKAGLLEGGGGGGGAGETLGSVGREEDQVEVKVRGTSSAHPKRHLEKHTLSAYD